MDRHHRIEHADPQVAVADGQPRQEGAVGRRQAKQSRDCRGAEAADEAEQRGQVGVAGDDGRQRQIDAPAPAEKQY